MLAAFAVLGLVALYPAVAQEIPQTSPQLEIAASPAPLSLVDNCSIRCDNGINVDGWEASCEDCLQRAEWNCNQQGTYGGWMVYSGWPSCSYFW
jgi:hypothetical protein